MDRLTSQLVVALQVKRKFTPLLNVARINAGMVYWTDRLVEAH